MVELKDIQISANHGTYYTGENMIIEDPQEMGSMVRAIIETNPMTTLLDKERDSANRIMQSYESTKHDSLDLKRLLQNNLIEENVYKQMVRKANLKVKHLEKAVENSTSDFKCDFLEPKAMAQFFEGIGLKFISLNIAQLGDHAALSYIRPARMISTLPVQPMIVNLYYELKSGTLRFKKPEISTAFTSSTNMHPHISGHSVCMGNFFDVFEAGDYSVHLEGYQDQVILLENLLSTFNPDSPYARIDQIIMAIAKGVSFNDYELQIAQSNSYTFVHPKLSLSQNYYHTHDLITEDLYRDFYAMLGNMPIKDTVQDIIDSLPNDYRSGDSANENYDHFCSVRSSLNKIFGITLRHPDNYVYCNDDDGEDDAYYELEEDHFEDMVSDWIDTLTPLLEREDHFEFANLPDLNVMFPKIDQIELAAEIDALSSDSIPF